MSKNLNVILYTVVVGGYDKPKPKNRERGLTHVIFTDLPTRQIPQPWVRMSMPPRPEKYPRSNRRWSRLPKICPHLYLPPHDISIYVDCSLEWFSGLPVKKWAIEQVAEHSIAAFKHPSRQCTYKEFGTCRQWGYEYEKVLQEHEAKLRKWKFPEEWGMTENGFLIRRNDPDTNRFNEAWMEDYLAGPMRDQLTFIPTLWRCAFKPKLKFITPGAARANKFCRLTQHEGSRCVGGDERVNKAQKRVLDEMRRSRQLIHA